MESDTVYHMVTRDMEKKTARRAGVWGGGADLKCAGQGQPHV